MAHEPLSVLLEQVEALPWRLRTKREEKLRVVQALIQIIDRLDSKERTEAVGYLRSGITAKLISLAAFVAEEILNAWSEELVRAALILLILSAPLLDSREKIVCFSMIFEAYKKDVGQLRRIYEDLCTRYPEFGSNMLDDLFDRDPQLNTLSAMGIRTVQKGDRRIFASA